MKKNLLFLALILLFLCQIYVSQKENRKASNIALACVEALAAEESAFGSAEKVESTWQDGPFFDDNSRLFYMVYTKTDCYYIGKIVCYSEYSTDIVYVE